MFLSNFEAKKGVEELEKVYDYNKQDTPYQAFAHEKADCIEALFFLPGIPKEHIDITFCGKKLTVEINASEEVEEELFNMPLNMKAKYKLELPCDIDVENIVSRLENGCLCITLPKAETAKVRKIVVA